MTGVQLQLLKEACTNTGPLGAALEEAVRIAEQYMKERGVCEKCGTEWAVVDINRIGETAPVKFLVKDHECLDDQLELNIT